jgi:hypothetical protein
MPASDLKPRGLPYGQGQVEMARRRQAGMPESSDQIAEPSPEELVSSAPPPAPAGGPPTASLPAPANTDPFLELSPTAPITRGPTREERAMAVLNTAQNPMMRTAAERILRRRGVL